MNHLAFWVAVGALGFGIFISALRMALNELSPGSLRKLEEHQPDLAETFSLWYDRRERYRIALRILQICAVVVVLISGSAWLRSRALNDAEWAQMSLIWGLLAAVVYLLGTEFLGAGLGRAWSRQLLRIGMPLTRLLTLPFFFIVYPLEFWHEFLTQYRVAGESEEEKTTTEDEILSLVEKDEEAGETKSTTALEEDERRMIRGIFDLDEMLVREIMTPRVDLDAVENIASLLDVKKLIVESGHSRIPVYQGSIDQMVGLIHAKDFLYVDGPLEQASLTALMHPVIFIPESKNVGDLLAEFQENTTHFGVVVDEYGGTAGVITLEDILEEIVGEIRDEYDQEESDPRSAKDELGGVFDARISIDDINNELDIDLPDDEDFDTLAGYLSYVLGHIPETGETVKTEVLEAEILEADERRVKKVCIRTVTVEDGTEKRNDD